MIISWVKRNMWALHARAARKPYLKSIAVSNTIRDLAALLKVKPYAEEVKSAVLQLKFKHANLSQQLGGTDDE